jgi:hypothetical protein
MRGLFRNDQLIAAFPFAFFASSRFISFAKLHDRKNREGAKSAK